MLTGLWAGNSENMPCLRSSNICDAVYALPVASFFTNKYGNIRIAQQRQ